MTYLESERATLESFLPGFDARLAAVPLAVLESPDSPAIRLFREAGGPGLLVPSPYSGFGATPLDAVRLQRAIGARSPSLAVATTMHHYSVAALVGLEQASTGFEWMLLQSIAEQRLLVASGFAEGVHGQQMFAPTMRAERASDGTLSVTATKKPCSLARSMDLLTASMRIAPDGEGPDEFGVTVVPAHAPGIRIEPFWSAPMLAGAESEAVVLTEVTIDPALVVTTSKVGEVVFNDARTASLLWFELMITASYLGMASALVERVLGDSRKNATMRAATAVELDFAMAALEGLALHMQTEPASSALLTRALACRYATQDAINRAAAQAVELAGGMAFLAGGDLHRFAASTGALAFHPPSRSRSAETLAEALGGAELQLA